MFTGEETLETLAKEFDKKLRESTDKTLIKKQMNRYESVERLFFTRLVPLFIKQPVVKGFTKKEAKTVTAVLSNLGPQRLPEQMQKYITGISDFCSTDRLFITATTYQNDMVLGVATAYAGTGVLKRLINALKTEGSEVTVYASEVIY